MPAKRAAFSIDEKVALRKHSQQDRSLSQKDLAIWFEESFGKPIRQPTVSEILSSKYSHLDNDLAPAQLALKKQRLQDYPDLERALHQWIVCHQGKLTINADVVRAKAHFFWHRLPQYHGINEPPWSNGWLQGFKQRYRVKEFIHHGEAASVDEASMAVQLAQIQARVAQYAPADQYNCDETGLYWKMVPDRGLATKQLSGVKKQKSRITIHHTCNATGSHKLPMWIIGKHLNPRCFKAAKLKSVESLGIKWRANKKAWMTGAIMVQYLRWFDNLMAGRKVILLMDNFSAHESAVTELESMPLGTGLVNTEICWLPPNTTSKLQPLDQGIIAAFKARYRKQWIHFMLEQYENGADPTATMNVLKAIQYSIRAWDEVAATTIANCWSHSKINLSPQQALIEADKVVDEVRMQLLQLQHQQRVREIMDVNALLNLPEEEVVDDSNSLDEHLIAMFSTVEEQESDSEEIVTDLPVVKPQEVINLLQSIKLGEMQADDCNADYIRWIERYEKVVKRRHIASLKQGGIRAFFKAT
jgi:hypothetical protein